MTTSILITSDSGTLAECESVIIVPTLVLQEAGYIKRLTVKEPAHAKHEYHAMAQMAYFQFQDGELEIEELDESISVSFDDESIELDAGMVICRNKKGEFNVLMHAMQNRKKLLEAAYRYCTRWVRLDI